MIKAKKVWRKLFGWKVGDKCMIQLKTKKAYATITKVFDVIRIPDGSGIPSVLVEFETKSPIPHVQVFPITKLLEDNRDGS